MIRRAQEGAPLLRAVRRRLSKGPQNIVNRQKTIIDVESFRSTRWASATFEGHRHEFDVRIDGRPDVVDADSAFVRATMVADDLQLGGELLADVVLVGEDYVSDGVLASRRLRYEALTVRD